MIDVLKTIRDHAFVHSDFPVILSIENHCSLPQQRQMALAFREILGDRLLSQPVSSDEQEMPSPSQMRRKFIIKHKKLSEQAEFVGGNAAIGPPTICTSNSTSNISIIKEDQPTNIETIDSNHKSGLLYMDEVGDGQLRSFFFVLTNTKLCYTDGSCASGMGNEEDEQEERLSQAGPMMEQELHYAEKWFHGRLPGRRPQAERLLKSNAHLGEGTFLVRDSDTLVGDYSLSFWYQNRPNHCRIRSVPEGEQTKYFLIKKLIFDSLYALITYYQTSPLRTIDFTVQLKVNSIVENVLHPNLTS